MKIVLECVALSDGLSHLQGVVERRTTIPILSNVLLSAKKGQLSLKATDMDLELVETIPADVSKGGDATVPAHMLFDIVRRLPEGAQIELEVADEGGQMVLRSGRSQFKLGCLPAHDFPQMTSGDFTHDFTLSAADLKVIIDRTKFAVSTEETRYYLNGIYIHDTKSKQAGADIPVLRAVATDGHRLARVEMPLPEGAKGMPGVILPRKTVTELRKLIETNVERVQVSLSPTKVRFTFGTVVLTSKLIDGTFPDYERVIPVGNSRIMEVPAKVLAEVVGRVTAISTEKSRAIKLALSNGQMVLTAHSPEAGSAKEELEISYDAPPLEIGFNSRYLLDITAQIEGEGVRFAFADSASPTVVSDVADSSALYVLMPMRV